MISIKPGKLDAQRALDDLVKRQLPYAISRAVNAVADDAYTALKSHVQTHFIVRKPQFILGRFRRLPADSATKTNPVATVYIRRFTTTESPGGILAKFVDGGFKAGANYPVAIPTQKIRPSQRQLVPQYLFPKALGLQAGRYTAPPPGSRKRKHSAAWRQVRPFVLDPTKARGLSPRAWGIYRRFGPGRNDIEMIWALRPRVPIPARLPFESIVRRIANERWTLRMGQALEGALATAGQTYGPQQAPRGGA